MVRISLPEYNIHDWRIVPIMHWQMLTIYQASLMILPGGQVEPNWAVISATLIRASVLEPELTDEDVVAMMNDGPYCLALKLTEKIMAVSKPLWPANNPWLS